MPISPARVAAFEILIRVERDNAYASELLHSSNYSKLSAACSVTGTLARNPEIKWRLTPEDLIDLQNRQLQILRAALRRLKLGGRLVYSICSLEREENEDVVERAFADGPSIQLVDCRSELERLRIEGDLAWTDIDSLTAGLYFRTILGVHPCDGFFAAIVERSK